ncbi:bifunctional protein-serine/threonine kinase/phosphatase [Sessilibacter corallicola]|uniref:bifunctional protein-serine/threonine kinase/phosphatase n=1 Tax=Sessilibacter corallicola TaxID=2904075 RepID=UPI001E534F4B|nr:bifunctional protein-serine/threonine kinase/phosphatase [Sessilibacter corallicola]MCE2029016.1 protein kinase [Sessilibacter corallicola]
MMNNTLKIRTGQFSDKGRKAVNQDYHGVCIPEDAALNTKGVAIALADGISSSNVSQEASRTAVTSFFDDYYSTSESWSVKKSVQCVLNAINSWLYSQTRRSSYRYNLDKGYVCTFSGMVIKSSTAHVFHVGDSRIYQLHGNSLETLTKEHRIYVSSSQHYLQRAMGMGEFVDFDYSQIAIEAGSTFFLTTDGIYEFLTDEEMTSIFHQHSDDLDLAAKKIVQLAHDKGSNDNLTFQILCVDDLPSLDASEISQSVHQLSFPPVLEARQQFDGFSIIRPLYHSARSHVYLVVDNTTKQQMVLKAPAQEYQNNEQFLERFLIEEWIAQRINSAHVLKPCRLTRPKTYIYVATEYIEGQTLTQWMIDNPKPSLEQVREIIEQIAKGLLAFHRLEMLHQDLRPENIMIDNTGTVKIIDFGSTWVAGLEEISSTMSRNEILGTAQYTAPEYFIGEYGTSLSDQFSLAVIAYQMLSGRLPYGTEIAKTRSRSAQKRLKYRSVLDENRETPAWVDFTLRKALNTDPGKRYEVTSEFLTDLRYPNKAFVNQTKAPLIERNPVLFWQGLSALLTVIIIYLLYSQQ